MCGKITFFGQVHMLKSYELGRHRNGMTKKAKPCVSVNLRRAIRMEPQKPNTDGMHVHKHVLGINTSSFSPRSFLHSSFYALESPETRAHSGVVGVLCF